MRLAIRGSTTAYAAQWSYSSGGRITSLVKGAGADAVTSTYAYEDAAHPAAVTEVVSDESLPIILQPIVQGVADDFESSSYSGGTGSRWTSDWIESNDDGSATEFRTGAVWTLGGRLCLADVGGDSDPGLSRTVDVTNADSAVVNLENLVQDSGAPWDSLTVTVTADGDPSRKTAFSTAQYGSPQLPGSLDVSSLLPASSLEVTLSRPASDGISRFCLDGLSVDLTATAPAPAPTATGPDAFTYDAAGRMISRTVDGVTTALSWDVTRSLTESVGQGGHVLYAYDAGGQRVAQVRLADADGPGTATAYVGSGQVEDPDTTPTSTGDVTATRYYMFAGSTVAVRTNDNKLALMLGDEQGSTTVTMPATVTGSGALASATLADASAVTRTSYTPYGELRGADNLAVDRGWLGQVEDRVSADGVSGTGLTYLNARYYDPATGRFISPDPLMNPGDPRTLDPYRYADNNPVVFTDATGLNPFGDAWSYVAGAADSSWDMAWEQQARAPISMLLTPDRYSKAMAEDKKAFTQSVEDYGWGTTLDRYLNPVHQFLEAGDTWITAVKAGDYNAAGRAAPSVAVAEASIALVAVPGAKFLAPKLETALTVASTARLSINQGMRGFIAGVRTANPTASTVLIGRDMNGWVIPMTKLLDAGYYKGTPSIIRQALAWAPPLQRAVDLAFNKAWIRAQMAAGKRILDIGQRDVSAKLPASKFYNAEQRATRNYSGSERYK